MSLRIKINGGFLIAFVFLLVITVVSYRNTVLMVENAEMVVHTHEVIDSINQSLSDLKDMETGQRGFVITGAEPYLFPYDQGVVAIEKNLSHLKALTKDNPHQQQRLVELTNLKNQKSDELKATIQLRRDQGFNSVLPVIKADTGRLVMRKFRALTDEMREEELQLLEARNRKVSESTELTVWVLILGGSLALLVVLGAGLVVNISENQRSRASQKLDEQSRIRAGMISLNDKMTGEQSISTLANNVVENLAKFTGANAAAIYLTDEGSVLKHVGSCAVADKHKVPQIINFGDGIVGQAAQQQSPIFISDLPDHYIKIASSLGDSPPKHVYVYPFMHEGKVKGVSEFAALHPFTEVQHEYLKMSFDSVAIAFNSAQARARMSELLHETQSQAEELQVQQEELSSANEELEAQQEELKQANEELEEQRTAIEDKAREVERASKYKSEFLANMSHELRTPLNSILLLSKSLSQNPDGNLTEDQTEVATTVYSSGKDLLNLINDILDLSKVEAGKLDLQIHEVAVAELAYAMQSQFQAQMKDKGLTFSVEIAKNCPKTIFSDRLRLEQILKNFLSNAFKFTEQGSISLLFDRTTDSTLAISVTDTGIGIARDKQKQIFGAFEQLDSAANRKYSGTGLGLSITRKLADLLDGEIQLDSTPGKGSRFTLVLPEHHTQAPATDYKAREVEPASPPKSTAAALPDDRNSITSHDKILLIVEDDANFAKILYKLCHARGFKCLLAADGESGLAAAKKYSPSAIILDLRLPEMSGMAVLENLKGNAKTRHIPVHVMSVDERSSDVLKMGAIGFLSKPTTQAAIDVAFRKIEDRLMAKPKKVLVVEDGKVERESIRRLIGDGDVTAVGVETATEALRQLKVENFDCVIMDLKLPDMSGFQLLEKIEKDRALTCPPVIIYTAKDLTADELSKLRDFSQSIIIKGVKSEERLLDEVTLFLHRVETDLPKEKQAILERLRHREEIFEKKKILIVDDDMRNVFALRSILAKKGFEIFVAKTGKESLQRLEETPNMDLVLMDIMMPEMDGHEAMQLIRKQTRFVKLPIIALTAKAMAADREKCLQAGANDYLPKPINAENLFSLLRIWLT